MFAELIYSLGSPWPSTLGPRDGGYRPQQTELSGTMTTIIDLLLLCIINPKKS